VTLQNKSISLPFKRIKKLNFPGKISTEKIMEKNLFLFANPEFDKRCRHGISKLYRIFCLEHGYSLKIIDLDFLRKYVPDGNDLQPLAIAGGDGTIHSVINVIPKEAFDKYLFGIIPGGTANEFARSLNIPLEIQQAATLMVNPRKIYKYHTGIINNKDKFVTGCVFGFENKILEYTPKKAKHIFGPNAFPFGTVLFLLEQLNKQPGMKKAFRLNNHEFRTNYLIINNAHLISKGLKDNDLAKSTGNLFSLIHIRTFLHKMDILRLLIKSFTRANVLNDPAICYRQAETIDLEFEGNIGVMLDGEPYTYNSPVNIKFFDFPITLISG
jgi:diacylglycerol kinase (ATP)